ncbi:alpha/beta hydrolase family protein [Aestuariivivens insulae]|uniref:alpha/beta hydrolase family protein n=1 Tax=Aestuariivivens insulae TaxID=1621988 RepID=UPI001F55B396|nr:prolyl oligopeptidase family serine peptidase [Aestuariivivens insulae]
MTINRYHLNSKNRFALLVFILFTLAFTAPTNAQDQVKKLVPVEDYLKWESVRTTKVSENGNWLATIIRNQANDYKLLLTNRITKKDTVFENINGVTFSKNSEWLGLHVTLPGDEIKKMRKDKKDIPVKMALVELSSLNYKEYNGINEFNFSGTGNFLASKIKNKEGSILSIKDLRANKEVTFGSVESFSWNTENDNIIIYLSSEDKMANSIQLYNASTGLLKVLDKKETSYKSLKWINEDESIIALRELKTDDFKESTYEMLVWDNPTENTRPLIFSQEDFSSFPKLSRIASGDIQVSKDGKRIFFDIIYNTPKNNGNEKEGENEKEASNTSKPDTKSSEKKDEEIAEVDIWNSQDRMVVSNQKASPYKSSKKAQKGVWLVDTNKFALLNDEFVDDVKVQVNNDLFIGYDTTPYEFEAMFGRPSQDVYTVNVLTGETKKVLTDVANTFEIDPNNKFFIYLKNNNLFLYDIEGTISKNITQGLEASFIQTDDDHPLPQLPAYGFGGWFENGKSCLIYSEYDIWECSTNGKMKNVTQGASSNLVYRLGGYQFTDGLLDPKENVFLSILNQKTKGSGFASGSFSKGFKTNIFEEAQINLVHQEKDHDFVLYSKSSYTMSPDVLVADLNFKNTWKVTNLNPFQSDYYWGKAELITYTNALGNEAHGILYYPANYKKGEKYPMITYIYERLSYRFHRYIAPSEEDYYNTTVWVQNGYFVFNPDIEFEPGNPGVSSAKNLEIAVAEVLKNGAVDKGKVGLVGHSWGGYQAAYVPTQTNIFAASVAGAGLTDLTSMNLAITPAFSGKPENDHFEVGQERMEVAPWVDPDRYIRNSPVMQIESLETPMLFEVGDQDRNVNWDQGLAYYNAARRAGKPFILLAYAKEGHGLRQEKNRKDYHQRILHWFGHYLKGEPAKDWMVKSIPYDEQQEILKK